MRIVTEINTWLQIRKTLAKKSIGFVPTMGHLHDGHLSLCHQSRKENDLTVVSIFINPTQFNHEQDFACYPRTLEQDQALLTANHIDYLLLPDAASLYPDQYQVQISEIDLSTTLEGAYRPGHFTGMLTIVLKLLNLAQASRAYFGEKDYQQLLLVKKMAMALFLPTDIQGCATLRAEDGLALSSRNSRLNPEQRKMAAHFPRLLHDKTLLPQTIAEQLAALGFKVDYITEKWQRRLGAVWLDSVRLIDNLPLGAESY